MSTPNLIADDAGHRVGRLVAPSPADTTRRPDQRTRPESHDHRVARFEQFDHVDRTAGRARTMRRPAVPTPAAVLATLGRLCLLTAAVLPAFAASVTERADVAAVSTAAAVAIVIGALRWAPSVDGDGARPVAGAALLLLGAVALELFVLAWGHPGWTPALLGPIATVAIVAGYLAAFGFRSAFLLRRLGLLSLLLWTPVAIAAERVVRSSLDPLSDLIYRRLASIDVVGVSDRPWRVFTAMTDRAPLIAIAAVVIGTAMSRRRLTARGSLEMAVAVVLAMVVHHVTLLATPIERYERTLWLDVVTGPGYELALGALAAIGAAAVAQRSAARDGRAQNPSVTAAPDRDPVLFAVLAADDAPMSVRAAVVVVPLALLVVLVFRTVA
ncbi:MAG: hypothetical protein NTZ21_15750 [Actinobacteria bacterium]|nr:hypothetical protein [Actinomycetota bacterium]